MIRFLFFIRLSLKIMELTLPYSEISAYLKEHYGAKIALAKIGENQLCVTYTKKVIFEVDVKVCLTIDNVTPEPPQVSISYSGGALVEPLIPAAIAFLYAKQPRLKSLIQKGEGHRVDFNLYALPKSEAVWEMLAIQSLRLTDAAINVAFALK